MKMTFNQWAQYPTTKEAQHTLRFITLKNKMYELIRSGYTQKVKRILVLMGHTNLYGLSYEPEELKQFEEYFNQFCENTSMSIQEIESMVYAKYPPAPAEDA